MNYVMIRAIIRPEKATDVLAALMDAGFPAATKMAVFGRGKQRGIKMGEIVYDELPKDQLLLVVPSEDKDIVVKTIMDVARTSTAGAYGDGKIFVSGVDEIYTISSGKREG
ncbi:P-II family nitrogen regulator [Fundidesulfovibrio putealis]|uniref:P-II family nitrogen regulator n=1 Tax=Fundidesulfovibrio putealis TaxID=270496 RepID=UPI00041C6646|nr:P-II family nitrogen regulator [Fundidesulfovibrio putealis]